MKGQTARQKIRTVAYLPKPMHQQVAKLAKNAGVSISEEIVDLAREALARREEQKPPEAQQT